MRNIISIALITLSISLFAKPTAEVQIPLRFDRYYNYADINTAIDKLAATYPELCKSELVGYSDEKREIRALIIHNPKTGTSENKPGVWVDGNIHGNEIQAGEVCLYLAQYLLQNHGNNAELTRILDKNTFYIVPVVNVDGRFHFFEDANTMHSNRSIRCPKDDDYDGLVDEDPMDDLDGDGNICQMRIKDSFGMYKPDPKDPRLMIRVKPGEKGEYSLLGNEGIDNDNDGQMNEDGEGYVDANRNWPGSWQPDYVQRGAGDFPLSGSSTRAVAQFFAQFPNIIISWNFHNAGGMFLSNPGRKEEVVQNSDMATYRFLGEKAEKIVPGYKYMTSLELYPTYGGTIDFAFYMFGAYGFVGELFKPQQETFVPYKKETDLDQNQQRLQFNDYVVFGELYKEWTPFKHPVYGDIEIGGWKKMSSRLPHPFMLNDLVHRNAAAVLFTAAETPQITLKVTEQQALENGLFRITVQIANDGMLPSMTKTSETEKIHPMDRLTLTGKKVIAGGKVLDIYTHKAQYKVNKPELQFLSVPGNGKVDYQFIVDGKGKITLRYTSDKATDAVLDYTIK